MAKRSRMSMLKRQRELRKSEKAARKRAKRHGLPLEVVPEPIPVLRVGDLSGSSSGTDEPTPSESDERPASTPDAASEES